MLLYLSNPDPAAAPAVQSKTRRQGFRIAFRASRLFVI
jgi:hypothetical protein